MAVWHEPMHPSHSPHYDKPHFILSKETGNSYSPHFRKKKTPFSGPFRFSFFGCLPGKSERNGTSDRWYSFSSFCHRHRHGVYLDLEDTLNSQGRTDEFTIVPGYAYKHLKFGNFKFIRFPVALALPQ